jgi:TolA-binding protein
LESFLSLEAGRLENLADRLSSLLAQLQALSPETVGATDYRLLETEIRLLRGNALIRLGEATTGIAELETLRDDFEDSAAAQRSYLIEAAYHGESGDLEAAQETLLELVERYPESQLAPQALYEAALYCERRGSDLFPEAIVLQNDLAEQYPESPLHFYARLKQGNLLRSMNDFAGAQIVYENLINRYPSHELRYLAELSRADCLLALAGNEAGELVDVIAQLERLLDLPNLPLDFQAEAAYKWAFALERSGRNENAKEVLSLNVGRLLLDTEQAGRLSAPGRYWVARSMLRLGSLL